MRPLLIVAPASIVFALDQATKRWAVDALYNDGSLQVKSVVGDVIVLRYVENSGFAFGFLDGGFDYVVPLVVLVIAVAVIAAWYWRHALDTWRLIAIGMILGGAISNLADRVRQNYVVDFIDIGRWPVFNIADSALTIGVALLAVDALILRPGSAPGSANGSLQN